MYITFIITGYVLNLLKSQKIPKIFGLLLILLCLVGVIITGERSNSLKFLTGSLIFISLIDYITFKKKILIFLSIFTIFFLAINSSHYVKNRYFDQFYSEIKTKDQTRKDLFLKMKSRIGWTLVKYFHLTKA